MNENMGLKIYRYERGKEGEKGLFR